jgi:hypothetical protein
VNQSLRARLSDLEIQNLRRDEERGGAELVVGERLPAWPKGPGSPKSLELTA